MKPALFLLSILVLFTQAVCSHAHAQELYDILQDNPGYHDLFTTTPMENVEQQLGLERQDAPDDLSHELSKRFYDNCMAQQAQHPLPEESMKEYMCLCSTLKMTELFEDDDIDAMFTETDEGERQRERLFGLGVMPCMEKPAHHLTMLHCLQDRGMTGKKLENQDSVCRCMADKMAPDITKRGTQHTLSSNPNIEDLLHRYTSDSRFVTRLKYMRRPCIYEEEYGW